MIVSVREPAEKNEADVAVLSSVLAAMIGPEMRSAVSLIGGEDGLFEEELLLLVNAVASRRREFAAGRRCARAALAKVGCPAQPIGRGKLLEPIWPEGFAGSITHDGRFAAAIAYPLSGNCITGSIDLLDNRNKSIFCSLSSSILSADEIRRLGPGVEDPILLSRIFSAKEAAIKIFSPICQVFIDFRDMLAVPAAAGFKVTMPGSSLAADIHCIEVGDVLLSFAASTAAWSRPGLQVETFSS